MPKMVLRALFFNTYGILEMQCPDHLGLQHRYFQKKENLPSLDPSHAADLWGLLETQSRQCLLAPGEMNLKISQNTVKPPVSDHPKGEDLMVVYENQTEDVFFEKRSRKQHYFLAENLLEICYQYVQFHVVTGSFVYSEQCGTNSEQRDRIMGQVVAYNGNL